jgi:hypothetical protein
MLTIRPTRASTALSSPLSIGTKYSLRVRARNGCGVGEWSAAANQLIATVPDAIQKVRT